MKKLLPVAIGTVLLACSSATPNPTVYDYTINRQALEQQPITTLVIAPFHLNGEAKTYLRSGEARVEQQLTAYLEKHGFTVISNDALNTAWQNALRQTGNPWDPTTGRVHSDTLIQTIHLAATEARQSTDFDALLVFDLIERQTRFEPEREFRARWDGVSRRVILRGPDNGVPVTFDWNQAVTAVSVAVNIYDPEFNLLFHSVGGIDAAQELNTRGALRFSRRDDVFQYTSHLQEGVALALHPLIPMKHYPGSAR